MWWGGFARVWGEVCARTGIVSLDNEEGGMIIKGNKEDSDD